MYVCMRFKEDVHVYNILWWESEHNAVLTMNASHNGNTCSYVDYTIVRQKYPSVYTNAKYVLIDACMHCGTMVYGSVCVSECKRERERERENLRKR